MSRPRAYFRQLGAQGLELVMFPPIDPLRFPRCPHCNQRHDLADPTDRCGVTFPPDLLWIVVLAVLALGGYAAWWAWN